MASHLRACIIRYHFRFSAVAIDRVIRGHPTRGPPTRLSSRSSREGSMAWQWRNAVVQMPDVPPCDCSGAWSAARGCGRNLSLI
jgi:hypothetical protein